MSSMTFGQKTFTPTPPDKGSFPLDHDGVCKRLMISYMSCLRKNQNNNSACREESRKYLECRMENNLMAKEDWSKLGYSDLENKHVATIKLPLLVETLRKDIVSEKIEIRVVVTERAKHFFDQSDLPSDVQVFSDEDEWSLWTKRGDPVLHIELGKWADLFLIAPLDANTLAKISNGLCDNLLTCTARAWDVSKPLIFCVAMNTRMFRHPLTDVQIMTLLKWGYHEIPVVEKTLMCGDVGPGAMAEVTTIVEHLKYNVLPRLKK